MNASLIAPCGMNCALCLGFQRKKTPCPGCCGEDRFKPKHCTQCSLKLCEHHAGAGSPLCGACAVFPCRRLKQLDKRYREKYHMSMIENLESIRKQGMAEFVRREKKRWKCRRCGAVLCVHRDQCLACGGDAPWA